MSAMINRRTVLAGTAFTGLVALLAACGSSSSTSASSTNKLEAIKSAGKIRVGLEGTYRPFSFHESNGTLVGFEKEIADLIAKDLGVTAEFVETPWDSLIAGVDADRYDIVINNVSATDERKQKYDFSVPYLYSEPKVAVKKDSSLQNVSEISGHSSAQSETSNFRKMVEAKGASIVVVSGFDEAIEQVLAAAESLAAIISADGSVSFAEYFKEHPDANLRLLSGDLGTGSNSSILMAKGQDALRNAIDESLKKHLENGDIKAIYEKYVGEDLSPKN